jgi:hypothetical protein
MIVRLIGLTAFLTASTSAFAAVEVCVACAGPEVTYRCTVEKSEKIEKFPDAQRVVEQACTKILVKTGSHAKCDINRAKAECPGDLKTIGLADVKEALAKRNESKTDSKVEGLLPGAARVTTEGLQKTGEAAKSAWDCVLSIFGGEC